MRHIDNWGYLNAAGWPMLCVYCTSDYNKNSLRFVVNGGVMADRFQMQQKSAFDPLALPILPRWSGLAVDSLVYTLPWFFLLVGIGAIKRRLRAARGVCPICAYDLRADLASGCPECGWLRSGR